MIMARTRQLAEGEAIQLPQLHPGLRRQNDATKSSRIQKLSRKLSRLLPWLLHCRWQILFPQLRGGGLGNDLDPGSDLEAYRLRW